MFRLAPAIALAAIVLGGCRQPMARGPESNSSSGGAGSAPIGVPPMISSPFTLTLSYGGGFSGHYEGCTLSSPDSVTAWRQRAAGPRVDEWSRKADPESLIAFVRDLEPYFGMELARTGNMTARIEFQSPGDHHSWSMAGDPASPDAPEPFRNWYPRVESYCRGLESAP